MKKSLIALAALAAMSAASAQSTVTISGKFGYQYAATQSNAGVKANGFNTSDGDVNFSVVEDLGGGLKAEAFMGIRLRGREVAADAGSATVVADQADGIGARDSRITLSGGFGSVTAGAVAAGSSLLARGTAGQAGYNGLDSDTFLLIDPEVNGLDLFQYTSPSFSGANAYVQIVDSVGNPGAGGLEKVAKTASGTVIGLNYANGPLSANIDTTSYSRNDAASATAWTPVASTADSRVRMSAQYDLGIAKVGFGYQTNDNTTTDVNQSIFGVSIPFGALSIGGAMAQRETKTLATGVSVKNKGYEIVANYDLSKRTSIAASIRSVNEGDKTFDAKATRIRLMHAF